MIKGLAHVIAMNPIFKSFFSREPLSCAMASNAPKGIMEAIAALAVLAPTALKKFLRTESTGKRALINAASIKLREVSSTLKAA